MRWKAARSSALLSLLFIVVYGTCNWLTSLRANVGSFYFEWERYIPFVSAMIVPYMSIDLFFIAAPFLCTSDDERKLFEKRIVWTILIAGACFLLFPLKFSFERPHVEGWLGVVFNNFREMDKPFNQFPSLHIALRAVLADAYARHTRGALRVAVSFWFSLIGISTLLTYQHHVIDVAGGFVLAGLILYVFREQSMRSPLIPNARIGIYFGIISLVCAAVALALRSGWLLLLWPSLATAIAASGYLWLGPGVFRKQGGRIPGSSWFVLWPVLVAQRLSLIHYARQCQPWNALTGRVWIGRKLSDAEAQRAVEQGVVAVLDLTGEFSEAAPFLTKTYCNIPVMDLTAPTAQQLREAIHFIRQQSLNGIVYIHCKIGYSRTAAVAGAYLVNFEGLTAEQAIARLKSARPSIVIRPEAIKAISEYADAHASSPVAV